MDVKIQYLKEAYLKCMRMQFASQKQGLSPEQHRDTVRTFAMGWFESVLSMTRRFGKSKVLETLVLEWQEQVGMLINSPDFYPDESWRWWNSQP